MEIVKVIIGVASKVLPLLFFWKAGKDHAENKKIKSTLKSIKKVNRARRDADKRARVRKKYTK